MTENEDAELVRRARLGDDAAFATLLERHAERLKERIRQRLSPAVRRKISASDIMQEAYLVAYRRLAEYEDRGEGSFGRWLARIVEHKALHAARRYAGTDKRAAAREVSRSARQETAAFAAGAPSPSQGAVTAELREAARRALAQLPADYREAIRLRQEEHLTLEAAAARMGRSKESVKKLYARGLALLAEALGVKKGTGHA